MAHLGAACPGSPTMPNTGVFLFSVTARGRKGSFRASSGLSRGVPSVQEWIKDTQNVAHVDNKEGVEQVYVSEEALVVQLAKAEAEMPTMTASPLCPRTGQEEDCGDPRQHSCQHPQTGKVVSLGGFTFVTSDNSYVML